MIVTELMEKSGAKPLKQKKLHKKSEEATAK